MYTWSVATQPRHHRHSPVVCGMRIDGLSACRTPHLPVAENCRTFSIPPTSAYTLNRHTPHQLSADSGIAKDALLCISLQSGWDKTVTMVHCVSMSRSSSHTWIYSRKMLGWTTNSFCLISAIMRYCVPSKLIKNVWHRWIFHILCVSIAMVVVCRLLLLMPLLHSPHCCCFFFGLSYFVWALWRGC